jgi:hypothetical protein
MVYILIINIIKNRTTILKKKYCQIDNIYG